ncbi:MAG: hypothetical protein KME48_13190, partial [Candidatus Thiodiazotropha sp. (ex Ctena orbiculata)]|nr:hypothetical protein [Candidatus Thiodiazotropha taylori]MBT3035931.1 hypothetical protein [Candidatus Thiodiazotropha taylori]
IVAHYEAGLKRDGSIPFVKCSNMKKIVFTIVLFLVASICYGDKYAKLSAPPGHYDSVDLGAASEELEIDAKIIFTNFDRSAEWPPGAYVGFYDENDRNNKFQFLIMRNKKTDNYVVAGYRVIESGKEIKVASISYFALNEKVSTTLKYSNGKVRICISGHDPVEITTKLQKVVPYISASSGEAEFEVALNKQRNADSGANELTPL